MPPVEPTQDDNETAMPFLENLLKHRVLKHVSANPLSTVNQMTDALFPVIQGNNKLQNKRLLVRLMLDDYINRGLVKKILKRPSLYYIASEEEDLRKEISSILKRKSSIFLRFEGIFGKLAANFSGHIPDTVVDTTQEMFARYRSAGRLLGKSVEAVVLALFYLACREHHFVIILKELATTTGNDFRKINQIVRDYQKTFGIVRRFDVYDILAKLGHDLGAPLSVLRCAAEILSECEKRKLLIGRDTFAIATAALYLACSALPSVGCKYTQKELEKVANISEVTIRNTNKYMVKELGESLHNAWRDRTETDVPHCDSMLFYNNHVIELNQVRLREDPARFSSQLFQITQAEMENIRDFFTGPPHPSSAYPAESSSLVFFLDKAMVSKILTGAIHYILTENEGAKALRPGNSKIYICQRDPSRTLRLIFVPKTVVINLPKEVARAFAQPGGVTPIEFDLFFRNANYLHLILINHNNLKETSTPFSELVPDVEIGHFQRSWAFKHSRSYHDYAFSCEEGLEEASEEKAEELEAAPPGARAGEEMLGNVSDEKIEELLEEGCLAEPREASKERVEEGGRKPEGEKDEEKEPMASPPVVRKSKELQAREKRPLRETTLDEFFH